MAAAAAESRRVDHLFMVVVEGLEQQLELQYMEVRGV
jgi:hypothetical protein